jgi:uncharacterized protein
MIDAYLDIETTGLYPGESSITVIGIYIVDEEIGGEKVVQLVGKDCCESNLLEALEGVERIFTYNGSRFDLPFIESAIAVSLEKLFAHHDLMFDCWRCRLYGGFKVVEVKLGIDRELKGVNGYEAVILWQRWVENGDKDSLDRLLAYNREDVVNLKTLKEKLIEHPLY